MPETGRLGYVPQALAVAGLEAFTEQDSAARFGDELRTADGHPNAPVLVIVDSTGQARLFRDPVTAGTLGHAELVTVIEQPAQQAGLTFDPPTQSRPALGRLRRCAWCPS